MMVALLMMSLSAAPVHVFAFSGDSGGTPPAQLLKKYDSGAQLVDASDLYAVFHPVSMLGFADFNGFIDPPARGWPKELAAVWTSAMAYCRQAAPPPWKGSAAAGAAAACSERLTQFLWEKYFERAHAERVFFILAAADPKTDSESVVATTFTPLEPQEHFVRLTGHLKQLPAHLDEALSGLMKPDLLQRQPRTVVTTMEAKSVGDPFAGEKASGAAVKLAKKCDAYPVSLAVSPDSVVAKALQDRWAASTHGRAPSGSCTLDQATHAEPGPGGVPMQVVTGRLDCGEAKVSAEVARNLPRGSAADLMTERLISALAARYCH